MFCLKNYAVLTVVEMSLLSSIKTKLSSAKLDFSKRQVLALLNVLKYIEVRDPTHSNHQFRVATGKMRACRSADFVELK